MKPKTLQQFPLLESVTSPNVGTAAAETTYTSARVMREAHAQQQFTAPFPPLELVTKPHLTTAELSYYTNMAKQSWRVKACYDTAPEGLRPLRVCGKLAWPTAGAKKLLGLLGAA